MATAPQHRQRWIALLQVWLVVLLYPGARAGLRLLHVSVPPVLLRGETASLQCEYELGGDRLYSVQWYKDDDEIYRFVPRAGMQKHSYLVDGVHVDRHSSDERRVVLRNVNLKSSGTYRCEVSAEAPAFHAFHAVNGEGRLEVVALPQKGPEITGLERPEYQMGDTLSVNCTSDRSYPAAKLRWYINDRPVDPSHEAQLSAHGLVRSQARLVVRVGPQHFKDGSMALRCVATIRPPNQQQLQQQHQHDQHEQHEHQREQQQQRQPLSAATGSHSQQRAEHAPLSSKHGHHQPLPRIAMEIDNREAKLFVRGDAAGRHGSGALLVLLVAAALLAS